MTRYALSNSNISSFVLSPVISWIPSTNEEEINSLAQRMPESLMNMEQMLAELSYTYTESVYVYLPPGSCAPTSEALLGMEQSNCTSICSDPATLFLPFNLEPCTTLGAASMLIESGNMTYNSSNRYNMESIESFGLGNLSQWDGAKIIQDVISCVIDSCTQYNISTCPQSTLDLNSTDVTVENLEAVYAGLSNFCENVGFQVNSDIAGPGVMISYIVQVTFTFLFWMITRVLTSWARVIVWPFLLLSKNTKNSSISVSGFDPDTPLHSPPSSYEKITGRVRSAWIRADAIQNRLAGLRLHAATVSTLVEFQEVQAFFIGAIQVATLATFRPTGSSSSDANSATSFGQVLLDSQLVQTLAIYGVFPLLCVQYMLHRYGKRWWYTFALVWITLIMALVIQARRDLLVSKFDVLWAIFKADRPVASCGNNANPMVYCNVYSESSTDVEVWANMMYMQIVLLTIDFFVPSLEKTRPVKTMIMNLSMYENKSPVYAWIRRAFWPYFIIFFCFLLQISLLLTTVAYFELFLATTSMSIDINGLGQWSFGQFVALLVWVPTLFKFAYYTIFGVKDGFDCRLASDYRVVYQEQKQPVQGERTARYANLEFDDLQLGYDDSSSGIHSKKYSQTSSLAEVSTPDPTRPHTSVTNTPEVDNLIRRGGLFQDRY